jgi:phospholipase C
LVFAHEVDPTSVRLDVGAGPRPQVVDNQLFFSVRADFPAVDVQLAVPGSNPGLHIPPFFITARFFLHRVGAGLEYVAAVESDLLDRLDPKIRAFITEHVEDFLNGLQFVGGLSRFGIFLRPWLVGGVRELTALSYLPGAGDRLRPDGIVEPATGELVVGYVGPKAVPATPPVLEDPSHSTGPAPDDGSERLFDVPDEDPDPEPSPGGGGVTPGPHRPPQIGALAKIDHIVVLMQENRSFDQVLGYLSRNKINPDVLGLLPPDDPRSAKQVNRFNNRNFFPERAASTAWPKVVGPSIDLVNSPCHDHDCVVSQMNNHMGGFVANWADRAGATSPFLGVVMDFFDNQQLPVYARLAREFGVCNHWYTSHVGPTFPNRFVLLTGDLNRDPLGNVELDQPDVRDLVPVQTPTLFDHLDDLGVSWRVFEQGYSFIRLFEKHTFDTTNVVAFDDPVRGFGALAHSGALPQVTLIEPDYIDLPPGNDDHPPADMADGQVLVRRVVQALVGSPAWERTLLVITYDEHGGFYDHVQPPTDAAPLGGSLTTLGPRVPAFVVSPLVARGAAHGTTFDDRFDHTSIGATILRRFAGQRPPPRISPRLDGANDLRTTLTLTAPRPRSEFVDLFKGLPPLPELAAVKRSKLPSRGAPIGSPDGTNEDFHWLLACVRLTTGEPPHRRPH